MKTEKRESKGVGSRFCGTSMLQYGLDPAPAPAPPFQDPQSTSPTSHTTTDQTHPLPLFMHANLLKHSYRPRLENPIRIHPPSDPRPGRCNKRHIPAGLDTVSGGAQEVVGWGFCRRRLAFRARGRAWRWGTAEGRRRMGGSAEWRTCSFCGRRMCTVVC
ncbi:hypothetical protein MRB53_040400 [Persea americana]|nr:hypothetical protein MRB53_040400 [Persea americana]